MLLCWMLLALQSWFEYENSKISSCKYFVPWNAPCALHPFKSATTIALNTNHWVLSDAEKYLTCIAKNKATHGEIKTNNINAWWIFYRLDFIFIHFIDFATIDWIQANILLENIQRTHNIYCIDAVGQTLCVQKQRSHALFGKYSQWSDFVEEICMQK